MKLYIVSYGESGTEKGEGYYNLVDENGKGLYDHFCSNASWAKGDLIEDRPERIEEKVRNSVKGYMDFENDTLKNLIDTSDLQTLLIKYPDLNSNELVKMEIETYKENSQKIKELKEKSVTRHYKAWWLYFGK